MLYIPRGIIHQAKATKDFSTHLTVSTYQAQNWGDMLHTVYYTFFTTQYLLHTLSTHQAQSWGDMLDVAIPAALSRAMDQSVDFRRGLPLGVFDLLGAASGGVETDAHDKARKVVASLMGKLVQFVDVSGAIDSMHYEFMARRLYFPPSVWGHAGVCVCVCVCV